MPEIITRPSPIIVQAVQKEGQPRYRHLWVPVAVLTNPQGQILRTPSGAIRYQFGKIYGPRVETRKVDGVDTDVLVPGQKFEYVGDPAALENDPHLIVLEDPDGLVPKAIKAKYAKIRENVAAEKARQARLRGEAEGIEPEMPGPVTVAAPVSTAPPAATPDNPAAPRPFRRRPPGAVESSPQPAPSAPPV